jgi:hypothetical protein
MKSVCESELKARFHKDAEQIAADLIAAYSLKFKQEIPNLSNPISRWLDFRFRYVDPMPRPVVYSDRLPKSDLPRATRDALKKFVALAKSGGDLNPYQGRGLILRNDSSGKNSAARTDLLWADWGILHFHLSNEPIPPERYFSKSADYLAFCVIAANVLAIIDVLPHGYKEDFSNPVLIKTIARCWPDYIKKFEIKSITADRNERTQEEFQRLRSSGINAPLTINGMAYFSPGGGITSACTPLQIEMAHIHLQNYLNALAVDVADDLGCFRTDEIRALEVEPEFSLAASPEGLCVYERHTATGFKLPLSDANADESYYQTMHNFILPSWACKHLCERAGLR